MEVLQAFMRKKEELSGKNQPTNKNNNTDMALSRIMECVPNFSEGRDREKIEKIVNPFRTREGVKLLNYNNDKNHNRLVVTVVGEPEPLREAVLEAVGIAVELIDLTKHTGQHSRMGAVDVIPFIPKIGRAHV